MHFWISKMRVLTLVLFLMIILEGCEPQAYSFDQKRGAITNESDNSQIDPSQTPLYSNSKFFGKTTPSFIPTEVIPATLFSSSTETSVLLPSSDASSVSNGNESDAAYVLIGQHARGQLALPKVPLVSQQDYTSCGEAVFIMGWNYKNPSQTLDIEMVETIGMTLKVYFPASSTEPHGYLGTSPSGMKVIGDYYADKYKRTPPTAGNINLDSGGAYARLEAIGLLYSQLSSGNPVIIEVTDAIGNPSKTYNDSHYVIVTGMNFDAGIVTFNDPLVNLSMSGKILGAGRSAEWSQIWASWFNNKDINPGKGGHPGRGWYMIVH
jgi:hypothetical protein